MSYRGVMRTMFLLALLLAAGCDRSGEAPGAQHDTGAQATPADDGMPVQGIDRRNAGKAAPDVTFRNPDGGSVKLAAFKGTPVLVNLWASWCVPCVKELPTLDRLAARQREDGALAVLAVSQDSGPQPSVKAFLDKLKVTDLAAFQDPDMGLSGALNAQILPTSILYDAQGREVWRYVGDLDWTGEEAAKLLAEARAGVAR